MEKSYQNKRSNRAVQVRYMLDRMSKLWGMNVCGMLSKSKTYICMAASCLNGNPNAAYTLINGRKIRKKRLPFM